MLILVICQFIIWIITIWFLTHIIMKLVKRHEEFENELEEKIDSSIQALDMCHNQIAIVAAKPIFFDSQEVRQVVNAIKTSRTAVAEVATIFRDIQYEKNVDADEIMPDLKYLSQHSEEEIIKSDEQKKREAKQMLEKVKRGEAELMLPQKRINEPVHTSNNDPHYRRNKIVADRINRSREKI